MTREELRKHCEVQIKHYEKAAGPCRKIYEEHKLVLELLDRENELTKTGYWRWVQSYPDNPKTGDWHCSECNFVTSSELISDRLYKYCPNCGAKMEANIDEILNRIIKKDVAKQIWAIAGISPEHGNAVMDIIGEEAYEKVMRLQSEENTESED